MSWAIAHLAQPFSAPSTPTTPRAGALAHRTALRAGRISNMDDASRAPRLPTHCPMCKGKVLQRMPNPTRGTVLWFHCAFCKHTWKFRVEDDLKQE